MFGNSANHEPSERSTSWEVPNPTPGHKAFSNGANDFGSPAMYSREAQGTLDMHGNDVVSQYLNTGGHLNLSGLDRDGYYGAIRNPAWASAVTILTSNVSSLAPKRFRGMGDRREEIELLDWVYEPSENVTFPEFVAQNMFALLHEGNSYNRIKEATFDRPTEVQLAAFGRLRACRRDERVYFHTREQDPIRTPVAEMFTTDEIVQGKALLVPPDCLSGIAPLEIAWLAIEEGLLQARASLDYQRTYGVPPAYISTEFPLTDEAGFQTAQRLWERVRRSRGRMPFLSHGARIHPLTVSAKEADTVMMRKFVVQEIARATLVQPSRLAESAGATELGSAVESRRQIEATETYGPWVVRMNELLTRVDRRISGEKDTFLELDIDAVLRGPEAARMETLVKAIGGGVLTPNEGRSREDLPPNPDPKADQLVIPSPKTATPPTIPSPMPEG